MFLAFAERFFFRAFKRIESFCEWEKQRRIAKPCVHVPNCMITIITMFFSVVATRVLLYNQTGYLYVGKVEKNWIFHSLFLVKTSFFIIHGRNCINLQIK